MAFELTELERAVRAAGVALDGCCDGAPAGGALAARTQDGRAVGLTGVRAGQEAQAVSAVAGFTWAGADALFLQHAAQDLLGSGAAPCRVLRAVFLVALDEINLLRQRLAALDGAVAAATSLADLKTRWSTVASAQPVPDRTAAQGKQAVLNKAGSAAAD
jgi:hypothetical protein